MLVSNREYSLEGAFKVDTYDSKGNMVETTDWFPNFITQTGLLYPTVFSFANCFRFLSIGFDGTTENRGGSVAPENATTALYDTIPDFLVIPPEEAEDRTPIWQSCDHIGYQGYETGNYGEYSSCGTQVTNSGVIFYRAWSFPTGNCLVYQSPVTIGEIGVSPSGIGATVGSSLFSRIRRTIYLDVGYRTIISYQLRVNMQSNRLTYLPPFSFNTKNASDVDQDLTREWELLSGYYKQTWMGLSCVDNFGASFIAKYGNGMEPYLTNFSDYVLYFSPDNAAFDVNPLNGGAGTTSSVAWASDGTMTPIGNSARGTPLAYILPFDGAGGRASELSTDENKRTLYYGKERLVPEVPEETSIPYNIRIGSDDIDLKTPSLANYTIAPEYSVAYFNYQSANSRCVDSANETISFATPGGTGLQLARDQSFGQRAIFANKMFKLPLDTNTFPQNTYAKRKKTITRKAIFSPAASMGSNTRFGSMVFGFQTPDDDIIKYYPTIDTLFYDNSGVAQAQHYRRISGIYLTCRGSGIVNTVITVTGETGVNLFRLTGIRTFHGPLYNGETGAMTGSMANAMIRNHFCSGAVSRTSYVPVSSGDLSFKDVTNGYSGFGSIYGFYGPRNGLVDWDNGDSDYAFLQPQDFGIARHHTGALFDNPTGQLYWPSIHGAKMGVSFFPIMFSGHKGHTNLLDDGVTYTDGQLRGFGYLRPTGYLVHWDSIGAEGYRLLPHHGRGRTYETELVPDIYSDITGGGTYPATSLDNGIEMYFHISWSSPCGADARECYEPE